MSCHNRHRREQKNSVHQINRSTRGRDVWNSIDKPRPAAIVGLGLALCLTLSGCLRGEHDTPATEQSMLSTAIAETATASSAMYTATTTPTPAITPTAELAPSENVEGTEPNPEISVVSMTEISPIIDQLVADVPARVGIVIEDRYGSVIYEHAPDDVFEAASLYKLAIMAEIYYAREAGILSFEDAIVLEPAYFVEGDDVYVYDSDVGSSILVGDALYYMITASSNVAAAALLNTVGSAQVNELMITLGLTSTEIRWDPFSYYESQDEADETFEEPEIEADPESGTDEESTNPQKRSRGAAANLSSPSIVKSNAAPTATNNVRRTNLGIARIGHHTASPNQPLHTAIDDAYNVTSPRDIARFFQLLLDGEIISPEASQEMLDLLTQQMINDRLPALLPDGTRVAHKTGNLPGTVHDAGVIFTDGGPAVVVVMSDDAEDEEAVNNLIRETSSIVYAAMTH